MISSSGSDRVQALMPSLAKRIHRKAAISILFASLVLLFNGMPSHSGEKCEYRLGYYPLTRGQQFGGMFRIRLNEPDVGNRASLQRHLLFSTTWANVLSSELHSRTNGQCAAIIELLPFPDLQVFLATNRSSQNLDRDKARCVSVLNDALAVTSVTPESVTQAASVASFVMSAQRSDPQGGVIADAGNILNAVLPLIYRKETVLHALVSVGSNEYQSLDVRDFKQWIGAQQFGRGVDLVPLSHCKDEGEKLGSRLPNDSGVIDPTKLRLMRGRDGPAPSGQLRHLIIIGSADVPDNPERISLATDKYCDKNQTFEANDILGLRGYSRIRCVRYAVYGLDSWIAFFCEGCKSEADEAALIEIIANDPDITNHARGSKMNVAPRGPYRIVVEPEIH